MWDRLGALAALLDVNGPRSLCFIVSGAVYQSPDWGLRPRGPPGILIRGLAAYSRSRACQSHTHSLTHTHTCHFTFSHKHLRFHARTAGESIFLPHTCAEEACLIAGCGLGSVFSFILILIGLCTWESFLLQWSRTSPYNERGFSSHDIIFSRLPTFERFLRFVSG